MKVSLSGRMRALCICWRIFGPGLADDRPRPIYRTTSEVEAREMVARLNAAAVAGASSIAEAHRRPLYWCELWESSSVIDTEKEMNSGG